MTLQSNVQQLSQTDGEAADAPRAKEAEDLLTAVQALVTRFIQKADDQRPDGSDTPAAGGGVLPERHAPPELQQLLGAALPEHGLGSEGFLLMVSKVLQYSVNVWDQGFLDKLYATTTPVGLAADMVLSALNTNVHVYQVSPALTIIEKQTCRALAARFGLTGVNAGGVSQPGGSAANQSSMVIARNHLFPETKTEGNGARRFVLFTSAHGHYSVEKAAQMFGFGSNAVRAIEVDEKGRMQPGALDAAIEKAKEAGETPFYINATAGTTVLGSFDPLEEIAAVAGKHRLWLHVDGSWGGSVVFSEAQRHKLHGIEKADSISICPHKMLNVPLTCSFLLGKDLRQFHHGMTLPAGYLFHTPESAETGSADNPTTPQTQMEDTRGREEEEEEGEEGEEEYWNLADLTPQCGRRGDSLKLALSWIFHGTTGFAKSLNHAFAAAAELASLIHSHPSFTLVSESPPPCLQVCFYFAKQRDPRRNSRITEEISRRLVSRGFMVDYAPGEEGKFFRVVVNGKTKAETVRRLVRVIEGVGGEVGA